MVKKVSTKKSPAKTAKTKRVVKSSAKKSTKVDYYPNRMTFAVSALAGTILVLISLITVINTR